MQVGKEDLQGVILRGIYRIFSGKSISRAHSGAGGVVPDQVIVLEEHLPLSLSVRQALGLFEVHQVFVIH